MGILPEDKRYSEARIQAAINIARDLYAKDDRVTPAVIMAAYDYDLDPVLFADMLDAYTTAIVKVSQHKRRVRREALKNLTQESENIPGGYCVLCFH